MSTDELTGVYRPWSANILGCPWRRGRWNGGSLVSTSGMTRSFIISRDVVTGQIVEPYGGPRRTEADFLQHVEAVIASDRAAPAVAFCMVDNLDTHRSVHL